MQAEQPDIWTVSKLTRRVKDLLEREVSYVWVEGEISNFRVSPAGHAYFTLKDKNTQVDAVMFRGKLMRVKFAPESGLEVVVHGQVTVYEKRGNYQIICEKMQPKGMGALQLAFEKLRKKLAAEGLFDEAIKKPIPALPKTIGIVTSPTGAAIRDILNVIRRRFANVHILIWPARVQGDEAAPEIAEGIGVLDAWGVDVMIVGRGGGSLEDLWPFNEESVVRAVHAAKTPVISAVGHEIDFTLTDFAADLRAPTPSAAAELVVQERDAIKEKLTVLKRRVARAMKSHVERVRGRLAIARSATIFRRPEELLRQRRQETDELRARLEAAAVGRVRELRIRTERGARSLALLSPANELRRKREGLVSLRRRHIRAALAVGERARSRFRALSARLDALSPLAILARGYALAWKLPEDELVREAGQLAPGDTLSLRFGKGAATATVNTIEEKTNGRTEV